MRFAWIDSRESFATETLIFIARPGRFAWITWISDSRESGDSRESCESIRANHATKCGVCEIPCFAVFLMPAALLGSGLTFLRVCLHLSAPKPPIRKLENPCKPKSKFTTSRHRNRSDACIAAYIAVDFRSESTNRSENLSNRRGDFLLCASHCRNRLF